MKTQKITLLEDLKHKSRSFQKKFEKKRGACINPIHSTKPLQPKRVNQLEPSLVLKGKNIKVNYDDSQSYRKKKSKGQIGSKTFLYVKTNDFKLNKPRVPKEEKNKKTVTFNKTEISTNGSSKSKFTKKHKAPTIMINLDIDNQKKKTKQVMWNPSTNLRSTRKDVLVNKKVVSRLDSLNEGG
jgi:hypothetical protein